MNPNWREELCGHFRMYLPENSAQDRDSQEGSLAETAMQNSTRIESTIESGSSSENNRTGYDASGAVHSRDCILSREADGGFLFKDIAPLHDRMLVFWSDRMVHSVQPSVVLAGGEKDYRWALTVWLTAVDAAAIVHDDNEVLRHFPPNVPHFPHSN